MIRNQFFVSVTLAVLGASAGHAACTITAGNSRCVSAPNGASSASILSSAPSATDQSAASSATMESGRSVITARFISAPVRQAPVRREHVPGAHVPASAMLPDIATFEKGERLPDDITVLFNRERYGLPAPQGGWTYFQYGPEIFRADLFTREVIDRVNDHMTIRMP